MKFAVNYSLPLVQLIKQNAIELDLIKCPDWEGMLEEAQPFGDITIHFDLAVGLGETFNVNFSRLKALKERTCTPHFNTHLNAPRQFQPESHQNLKNIVDLWRKEIELMANHLGADQIVLEHLPYNPSFPHLVQAADPEIFSKVIYNTGCKLLLDLAHARITANTMAIDVRDYIEALPLERVAEIHITGVKLFSGELTDHFELGKEDWAVFDWALQQIKKGAWRTPEIIAFEYGGVGRPFAWRTDPAVLGTQVLQISKKIKDIQ